MGFFSRTRDVKEADLDSLLAGAADPLKAARLIINEMEDTLVEARSAAVRTLARKKELERRARELQLQSEDWERKAALAVEKEREDLARGALAVKLRADGERSAVLAQLPTLDAELTSLEEDLAELRGKLVEARERHRRLQQQSESNKARQQSVASSEGTNSTGNEPNAQAYALGERKLADQFAALEQSDAVESELARLRSKLNKNQ